MPEKLTTERLEQIANPAPTLLLSEADDERIKMAREILQTREVWAALSVSPEARDEAQLALRAHGEAAPEPYGAIGHHPEMGQRWVSADRLRHYQEHGDWELTLLYPAPPPEARYLGPEVSNDIRDLAGDCESDRWQGCQESDPCAACLRFNRIEAYLSAPTTPKESPDA